MELLNEELEEFVSLASVKNYDKARNFIDECPLTYTDGSITYNFCPLFGLIVLFILFEITLIGFDGLSGIGGDTSGSGYGAPSTGYDAPSTSYGSPPSSYDAPSAGYESPAPSYSSPASTYGLRNQDLYYPYPEAFQNVDENFGNVDLTQTQNDYLTRLLSSNNIATGQGNNGATSQGNIAYQGNGIAGVNVQYPSYNPYLANYQLQQQQLQQHQAKRK